MCIFVPFVSYYWSHLSTALHAHWTGGNAPIPPATITSPNRLTSGVSVKVRLPSDLWNIASVPSARATSTRPFTCLQLQGWRSLDKLKLIKIKSSTLLKTTYKNKRCIDVFFFFLHQTEHWVFKFDGVETLLPVSHSWVDIKPGRKNRIRILASSQKL